jgi:hypothetical protein
MVSLSKHTTCACSGVVGCPLDMRGTVFQCVYVILCDSTAQCAPFYRAPDGEHDWIDPTQRSFEGKESGITLDRGHRCSLGFPLVPDRRDANSF